MVQAIINGRLVLENKVLEGCALLFDTKIRGIVSREQLIVLAKRLVVGRGNRSNWLMRKTRMCHPDLLICIFMDVQGSIQWTQRKIHYVK